ncbi:PTS fructose transporter subunit IIB [Erysipelotrichaceae bacterium MTC7]|nr:PTS fructose transporter subunit IIB [Erysipelotrichaceae bacterium MTC7]
MISFIRVDDRIIHGQIVTRWSKEYPCDGIIAVNDKAATTPVLKQSFKASTDKKVLIWTMEEWKQKCQKAKDSDKKYFLITKNPVDMAEILVHQGFVPNDVKRVVIGPANDRPGATKLGQNQSITQEEAVACEEMTKAGYDVYFALLKETAIGSWPKFRSKFGFTD